MHGPGGAWSQGGLVETPPTATASGGKHPTGMHSCLDIFPNKEPNVSDITFAAL